MQYLSTLNDNVFLDTKRLLGDWCSDINFIKINYYEHDRTKHLLDNDIYERLIITLGSKGSVVFENKLEYLVDPISLVELVDTTGAGDLFAAGFLFGYINKYSIEKCGYLGNKAASEIIKHIGARPKISLKEIL